MADIKKKTVSDLNSMQSSEISDDDLLLVSDTNDNNGAKYQSKKLEFKTLQEHINDKIADQISNSDTKVNKELKNQISSYIETVVFDCGDSQS